MPRSYQEIIRLIENGDPVDSSINSILSKLAGNIDFVKLLLEEALLGQMNLAREQSVDAGVKVGQPVYFDTTEQVFKRAYAQASVDLDTGELLTDPSSHVLGICYYKHDSTLADILLSGKAELDMTEAIDDPTVAGIYYLSGTTAGKLVYQKPPVSIPVLFWDGDSTAYVSASLTDVFTQHQHYKFTLQPIPAGTHAIPSPGGFHAITSPDANIEGWLPADHASFNSKAPTGAKFGYNIAASQLNNLWPPMPLGSCTIGWVRPTTSDSFSADLPGDKVAAGSATVNTSYADASTTTVTIPVSPSVASGVPFAFTEAFTDEGLTISNLAVDPADNVSFDVTNETGASVAINALITVGVFAASTFTVEAATDFKEDQVPDGLVVMDNNGIWWMSDCYGLVPWPVDYGGSPATPTETDTVIWADTGYPAVMRAEAAAAANMLAVGYGETFSKLRDVTVDDGLKVAYATTQDADQIVKVYLDTAQTYAEVIYENSGGTTSQGPWGIAMDTASQKLYFTDNVDKAIYSLNVDGTGLTTLVTGLTDPRAIRYSTFDDKLYYIDDNEIRRCDTDGTNDEAVIVGLSAPQHLTTAAASDFVYFTDTAAGKVIRGVISTGVTLDLVTGEDEPRGIDIRNSNLYWINGEPKIRRSDLSGGSLADVDTLFSGSDGGGLRVKALTDVTDTVCGDLDMTLTLWFTKSQFQTANTAVTSLAAAEDSGLSITCIHNGEAATRGDLEINLDMDLLVDDDDDETGYLAFKRFQNNRFFRGPVVSGVKSGSSNVTVTGSETVSGYKVGQITVSVDSSAISTELPIQEVRLNGVEEENYKDTLGLSFKEGYDTEYRAKVNIPAGFEGTTVRIKLRFQVLTRANGDIPALTLTARTVPRPGVTTGTSLALPVTDSAVTLSVAGATSMVQDNYVELLSAEIDTTPGGYVLFTLSRAGSTDSFAGELHILDQRAVVTAII